MLLGYDPISRLVDAGSPSAADRRTPTAVTPILEMGDRTPLHATTPMGLTVGNLINGQVERDSIESRSRTEAAYIFFKSVIRNPHFESV